MELKKYINQIEMNKIAKSALAMVLAGSFTFSSTQAFASDTTTTNGETVVEAPSETAVTNTDTTEVTNGTEVTNTEATTVTNADVEVKAPTLVPGDFFYFAKLTIEKIKLILTMDDVKEAELLATFASERLAEVERLFAEGKEELALETIEKALADMKLADKVVEEQKETTTVEGEKTTTEGQTSPEAGNVTEPTVESTPETNAPATDATTEDVKAVEEVEEILSQNIIALKAAMEKVQNPVAKAALQKNIDKSYAKLKKKLAKIEARLAKKLEETEEAVIEEQEKEVAAETEVKTSTEVETKTTDTTTTTTTTVEEEETTTVLPTVKKEKAEEKKVKVVKEEKKQKPETKKVVKKEKRENDKKETKVKAAKEMKENKGKSEEKKNDKK